MKGARPWHMKMRMGLVAPERRVNKTCQRREVALSVKHAAPCVCVQLSEMQSFTANILCVWKEFFDFGKYTLAQNTFVMHTRAMLIRISDYPRTPNKVLVERNGVIVEGSRVTLKNILIGEYLYKPNMAARYSILQYGVNILFISVHIFSCCSNCVYV